MNDNDSNAKVFCALLAFTVKVLVWQEFKLILVLTICSKQIEKRSQAASSYYRIRGTTVIVQTCDNFLGLIIYTKKTTQFLLAEKGVHFFCYTSANL